MLTNPEINPPHTKGRPAHGLFFAIMIPPQARVQIESCFDCFQQRYAFHGGAIEQDRLHLSLRQVYAGADLPSSALRLAKQVGTAIRFAQFAIKMDKVLTYRNARPKKPFVLATQAGSDLMDQFVRHIAETHAVMCKSRHYTNHTISPHITLAWDRIVVPEHHIEPVIIPVQDFSLVHSHIGQSRYDILESWSLVP